MSQSAHDQILVISKQSPDREFGGELAAALSLPIHCFDSADAAVLTAQAARSPIILLDVSEDTDFIAFTYHFKPLLECDPCAIPPKNIHIINSSPIDELPSLRGADCFGHFIFRCFGDAKNAANHYSRVLRNIDQGISDDEMPSSGLLQRGADKTPHATKSFRIRHSNEKTGIIEMMNRYMEDDLGISSRISNVIATAVDELLMNAIYDAPQSSDGQQRFSKVRRDTPIELDESSFVEFLVDCDDHYLGVTVVDQFGTLNRKKLFNSLLRGHMNLASKINAEEENAGIGLATTFKQGGSLVYVTRPGKRTEATTFFKLEKSYRDFKNQFRFVSVHIT